MESFGIPLQQVNVQQSGGRGGGVVCDEHAEELQQDVILDAHPVLYVGREIGLFFVEPGELGQWRHGV
jgi:hypothetical protein